MIVLGTIIYILQNSFQIYQKLFKWDIKILLLHIYLFLLSFFCAIIVIYYLNICYKVKNTFLLLYIILSLLKMLRDVKGQAYSYSLLNLLSFLPFLILFLYFYGLGLLPVVISFLQYSLALPPFFVLLFSNIITFIYVIGSTIQLYTFCFVQFILKSVSRRKKRYTPMLSLMITWLNSVLCFWCAFESPVAFSPKHFLQYFLYGGSVSNKFSPFFFNIFILPSFLRDSFARYKICAWQFFFFLLLHFIHYPTVLWPPLFLMRNQFLILKLVLVWFYSYCGPHVKWWVLFLFLRFSLCLSTFFYDMSGCGTLSIYLILSSLNFLDWWINVFL